MADARKLVRDAKRADREYLWGIFCASTDVFALHPESEAWEYYALTDYIVYLEFGGTRVR
jgi:hypothetical protein